MGGAEVSQGGLPGGGVEPLLLIYLFLARFWDWREMDECNWMTPPLQLLWLIEGLRPGGK